MFEDTFDTKMALSALYLWLLFGFLSTMVSCDLQRWMNQSPFFRHFIGLVAFFFLFTVLDQNNSKPIEYIWAKTVIVYGIFILMTKSKWQYSLPVLLLLVIDQTIRVHTEYLGKMKVNVEENKMSIKVWEDVRYYINILIGGAILFGVVHYYIRQKREFGNAFSLGSFFFTSKCKI